MNKQISLLLGTVLACAAGSLHAADSMKQDKSMGMGMSMDMKTMDTNNDGMISKEEFMRYHEAMYEKMKKNKNGMVDAKDMSMMRGGMMMKDDPMKSGTNAASTGMSGSAQGTGSSPGK